MHHSGLRLFGRTAAFLLWGLTAYLAIVTMFLSNCVCRQSGSSSFCLMVSALVGALLFTAASFLWPTQPLLLVDVASSMQTPSRKSCIETQTKQQVSLYHTLHDVPKPAWTALSKSAHPSLQWDYLAAIEQAPPHDATLTYALFHEQDEVVAIAYFQRLTLDLNSLGQDLDPNMIQRIQHFQKPLLKNSGPTPRAHVLLCGNALASDDQGFHHSDAWSPAKAMAALAQLMQQLCHRAPEPIALLVCKDFPCEATPNTQALAQQGFHRLRTEPTMTLPLLPTWAHFDDYLAEMKPKYRQRAKAAQKKAKSVQSRFLSLTEMKANAAQLQLLLDEVMERAGFRLTSPSIDTICALKQELGNALHCKVYTLPEANDRIIGMSLARETAHELDAMLVGLDYTYNRQYALYQNMLYDFVTLGIHTNKAMLCLGRSAPEIKSTIGAVPHDRCFYLKHTGTIVNHILSPFLALVPQQQWIQRHPFKTSHQIAA